MTNSSSSTLPAVRLGAISFVNTVPIYSAFQPDDELSLIYDVPARLNARILAGELEISPVSSACYLRHQDQLVLLDDLSVSSPGAVESVLFLSREPLGAGLLDLPIISVPNDSETSVMLLAYLLREATGQDLRPWFRIYEAADYQSVLAETGNALIIGDNALMMKESLSQSGEAWHCYDLSSLWRERHGLPFVFAVWVANRQWAMQHPERLQAINQSLCAARDAFFSDNNRFQAGLNAAQRRSHLSVGTLERYYRHCLSYRLNPTHHEALTRFAQIIQNANHWEAARDERQATR